VTALKIFAKAAYLHQGWCENVRITVQGGKVSAIQHDSVAALDDERCDVIIPGLCNHHSHAFQRGMAGLAEVRGTGADSFWSWRKTMYAFALAMNPDHVEAVAAQAYIEMLEAGFTRVGEFHYLHHDVSGAPYGDVSELAQRIAAAAADTGMALTLLPVFYAHAGFGGMAPQVEQRRFITSIDQYEKLVVACRQLISAQPRAKLGIAPHSLRAATAEQLQQILPLAQGGPVHIHIAEQTKEVDDCVAWSGKRPVDWLLANAPVSSNWTLIHATHMTGQEALGMAKSGAIAGLCPITEANLGDGVFPANGFLDAGGQFGVGSDSNVRISAAEELRMLEYSQRLVLRSRNVIATPGGSTGARLFGEAIVGGAKALHGQGHIEIGGDADLVALDRSGCDLVDLNALFDTWIFGAGVCVDTVWVGGKMLVRNGRHAHRDIIVERFKTAMRDLLGHIS
jgi:formimidoylglutamate deiminase